MSEEGVTSICALEAGKEHLAAHFLGAFDIEECGPLTRCAHRVEKFDYTQKDELYVEMYYCEPNWGLIATIATVVILALLYAWFKKRQVVPVPY